MRRKALWAGSFVFAAMALVSSLAWALGFQLNESKEELKLKYDVEVTDHGTGRVTVVLTLADQGRLKPLDSIDLHILEEQRDASGGRYADLSVSLAPREENGKQVVRIHLLRTLAERAEIHLKTHSMDGRQSDRTWFYHSIPIAHCLKDAGEKRK